MYRIEFTKTALRSFKKMDKTNAKILLQWIKNNLDGINDPRALGKSLQGNLSTKWRYRKGNYRIITEIKNDKLIILIVDIGHRKDIYKRFKN